VKGGKSDAKEMISVVGFESSILSLQQVLRGRILCQLPSCLHFACTT